MATYTQAIKQLLPHEYASQIGGLPPSTTTLIDAILRFASGGDCPQEASVDTQGQWSKQQALVTSALERLKAPANHKRGREDDTAERPSDAKKAKSSDGVPEADNDLPLYTLHAISVSSPIRKKVNIAVHQSSIRFINPATNATELNIAITNLKRAFMLPTRGKTKPHWTVILMSSDIPAPSGKAAASTKEEQPQVIFGVDATPPPFSTTDHTNSSSNGPMPHPKGTPILPFIQAFLSHLPFRTLEPSTSVFRSALSTGESSAGVEGYRGAKSGTLWFLSEGILWDGKPCEFWSLSELVGGRRNGKGQADVDLGGAEGVRTVSATGRSCSVILSRKLAGQTEGQSGEDDEEAEEDQSVDTDVGMVDGKEQEGIARWVKKHRHLFGVAPVAEEAGTSAGNATKPQADEDDSDEDDSDFEGDSSTDGGSPTSSSGGESGDEGGDDAKSEDLGSGSERSEDAEEEGGDEEEELDPKHHPLMRPGAMPQMSRAAIDAVVGMVQDDLLGGSTSLGRRAANGDTGESGDEEEDELDD